MQLFALVIIAGISHANLGSTVSVQQIGPFQSIAQCEAARDKIGKLGRYSKLKADSVCIEISPGTVGS